MAKSKKIDPIFGRFDALTEAMEAHMKKIREEGKIVVKTVIDELFKRHESLLGVQWTQFTQYFNDGDECHFYVHEARARVEQPKTSSHKCAKYDCNEILDNKVKHCPECGTRQYVPSSDDYLESCELKDLATPELIADIETLSSKISDIDDAMKYSFGDHKRITVTRQGVDVEDYTDHD